MRLAFDISPLKNSSNVRGIGTYTQNLAKSLEICTDKIQVITFWGNKIPTADLVHYPYFDIFFHTLPLQKSKPRVVTIHDVIPLIFKKQYPSGIRGQYNLLLQKLALRSVDAVICDSNTSKNDVHQKLGVPLEKIHVIYLAPAPIFKPIENARYLKNIQKSYKLPQDYFLYVGDVNWNKNIQGLLHAVKEAGINLIMVGEALTKKTLPQVQELENKIRKYNLEKRIIRTGFIPNKDLCAIYNLATATIVPSFYEGFGLSVVESMACGTPVICSNNSSLAEIGGDVAIYCDPSKPSDVAKQIKKLVGKDKKTASHRLIKHASQYNWARVANKTIEVYKKVTGT